MRPLSRAVYGGFLALGLVAQPALAAAADSEAPVATLSDASVAFSVDRVFGGWRTRSRRTLTTDAEVTETSTGFDLGYSRSDGLLTRPRLGLDLFLGGGLTLGFLAGLSNEQASKSSSVQGEERENELPGRLAVLVGTRFGYVAPLKPGTHIWPRLGFSYVSFADEYVSASGTLNDELDQLASLTLEAPFVLTLVPQAALLIGPVVEYSVFGERGDTDEQVISYGVAVGLVLWSFAGPQG